MAGLFKALPALLVAVAGVGLAWLGYEAHWAMSAVLVFSIVVIAEAIYRSGRAAVRSSPVSAIPRIEARILVFGAIAAGASALLIFVGVEFEPDKQASEQTKQLLAASAGALTAFITALWVKNAEEADEEWISSTVRADFHREFADVFPNDSPGANAVFAGDFGGESGWGREARRVRAEAVAGALAADK